MSEHFDQAMLARIEAARRETVARLAVRARHFNVERDPLTSGWIVRNPRIPGRIELVSEDGARTCQHYRMWDRFKHAALVEVLKEQMETEVK